MDIRNFYSSQSQSLKRDREPSQEPSHPAKKPKLAPTLKKSKYFSSEPEQKPDNAKVAPRRATGKGKRKQESPEIEIDLTQDEVSPKPNPGKVPPKTKNTKQRKLEAKPPNSDILEQSKPKKKSSTQAPVGPLSGSTFVITGILPIPRDECEDLIKSLGGRVTKAVSNRTTYLIYGEKLENGNHYTEGAKYRKAKDLKKKLMSYEDFESFTSQFTEQPGSQSPEEEPELPSQSTVFEVKERSKIGNQSWTDKYKPRNLRELIGNSSSVKKIVDWLSEWEDVVLHGNKKQYNPIRNGKFDPQQNQNASAILLSGPPGIGKTSAVRIIAKGFGYYPIEFNASDTRSRKTILEPLKSRSVSNSICANGEVVKSLLIMDEVDGMSGGDRGGISAIIDIIKSTKIPIICICNDRQNQKLKSLANHCYDIRFSRPTKQQIVNRLLEVLHKEQVSVAPNALEQIIETSGNDIRQLLNTLELWSRTHSEFTFADSKALKNTKDANTMINDFDAAARLLRKYDTAKMTQREKLDLFFINYDLVPLLVHENYYDAFGNNFELESLAEAAESIAISDLLNKKIRNEQEWSLLQQFGQLSSITPGALSGGGVAFPRFPEFFGKLSSQNKKQRLISEVRAITKYNFGINNQAIVEEIVPLLYRLIVSPLLEIGHDSLDYVIETMFAYGITPDILKEHLILLQFDSEKMDTLFKKISTSVRTALTRNYNKLHSQSMQKTKKKKKASNIEADLQNPEIEEINENPSGEEEEEVDAIAVPINQRKSPNKKQQPNKSKRVPKKKQLSNQQANKKWAALRAKSEREQIFLHPSTTLPTIALMVNLQALALTLARFSQLLMWQVGEEKLIGIIENLFNCIKLIPKEDSKSQPSPATSF